MSKLRLSLACWNYDRTRALMDGSVQPDGIDLTYLNLPVEETFFRMLRNREFDVAEMSLSSYTVSMFREPRPFVAIPMFPSRFFRHSSHLRQCELGHPRAQGPHRQAHRHAGVPDDGAGVDSRHPGRALRRAGRQRYVLHRRRGRAGTVGEDQARPAAWHQGRADRADADARVDAREWRDRRAAHRAYAVDVLDAGRAGAPALRELQGSRAASISAGPASSR